MRARSWISRWAVAAAVCALVLRAGVPLLAAGAASLRGVGVADVCDVYGVALPGAPMPAGTEHTGHHHDHAGGSHAGHGPHSDAEHGGGHCALTALGALAPFTPAVLGPSAGAAFGAPAVRRPPDRRPDAMARWAAQLQHGPPGGRPTVA